MHEIEWGLLIVIYLFCGGLSAGAIMLSAAAHLSGRTARDAAIARAGALAAPLPVIFGTGLLVFDLGRPFFFWKLFVAAQPLSPMWIGSWLLAGFSALSLAYAYLHLPARWQRWAVPDRAVWMRRLAIAVLPFGLAVAVYTAVLLGVLVARPLWNTPLLSLLFVCSALSSGAALLMVLLPHRDHGWLARVDVVLIGLEIVLIAALLLYGSVSSEAVIEATRTLAGGEQAAAFWIGVVLIGLLVPLGLGLMGAGAHGTALVTVAASCVLLGGFLLRYVIVYAGQQ